MPKILLPVLHRQQRAEADCLPACAAMVLDYWGVSIPYAQLLKLLHTREFGTPFRAIQQIEQLGVVVEIAHLSFDEITVHLMAGRPVLVGVHTGELGYWSEAVDHVVVVVGADETQVYVNDPSLPHGEQAISQTEFELAQLEFDNLCAVVSPAG
jgi:ABC-type bacteriocin/lantibiotic exporter with double-glycine peptidase domain